MSNRAHPAQADNLEWVEAVNLLTRSSDALIAIARQLAGRTHGPNHRAILRRALSGVLADVETVRQAIKE